MNRLNRSLLSAAVAAALCGGIGFVQAAFSHNPQSAQRLDEDHWKHPHMHHALDRLRDARKELDASEDVFQGHKAEALDHVDRAIKEIEDGIKEQNDEAAMPSALPPVSQLDEGRFPHMHHALDHLREARTELDASDKVFGGHRDEAITQTDRAIKQLEDAIHDAEK